MRLTQFTDFALRALIFLEAQAEPASLRQIAAAYGISHNHLVKVINQLQKAGFITTKRGHGGGVALARPAAEINLGEVVRATEPDFALVPCMEGGAGGCRIAGACALTCVLGEARDAFLGVVAAYTLADVTRNKRRLALILGGDAAAPADQAS